ncbi:hypothetical protein [Arthrobacter sp. ES1]|uniref:hypothetical protein n=1 Tax=Arthrobacter sp. ES1 TaxID=1897056 RepID=UPI001CFF7DA3|nr:hypothetical protein [Arthrobacter sp. ES1]MCB5280336.1 hypothetical protein [Arthrobacter sp. ES1]
MWLTPLQTAVVVALVLAYIVVTRFNAAGPRVTRLRSSHAAIKNQLTQSRRDFEKDHHLVVTPPVGTPVVLITDSWFLQDCHGAAPGHEGTVIEPSRLSSDDTGVLVDWGVRPNDMVRMDLNELKLAPRA